jgi:AcrR family transcriptional regulator
LTTVNTPGIVGGVAKKPYHHGDLRRALLDATLALASERGAGGVTLREAARAAGVSQTAPYRHFADKDAMLAAAAEEGFRLLHQEMTAALAQAPAEARARLLTIGVTYVRFALEHAPHFRLMFGHGSPAKGATPGLQQAARDVFQLFSLTIEGWLGKPARDAAVTAVYFRAWALAHGIAALALERQILFDLPPESLLRSARDALAQQLPRRVKHRRIG